MPTRIEDLSAHSPITAELGTTYVALERPDDDDTVKVTMANFLVHAPSYTVGTLPAATSDTNIDMNGNSIVYVGILNFTETGTGAWSSTMASHKLKSSGLTLEATSATLGGSLIFNEGTDNGTDAITVGAPAALTASYSMELPDDLPTAAEAANGENWLRIDENGKWIYGSGGTGGGGAATYQEVDDKASRPTPTYDGFRVKVATNQIVYVWYAGAWYIDSLAVSVTEAEWAALTELEENQLAFVIEQNTFYRWTSTDGWVQQI